MQSKLATTTDSLIPERHGSAGYQYSSAGLGHAHAYLLPTVERILNGHFEETGTSRRLFDLGCGNGSVAAHLAAKGYEVVGVDTSTEGVEQANRAFPHLTIEQGSAYDDLESRYGTFPAAISLEVVEHVYAPRQFARTLWNLLEPGGIAIVSTPFHGYLKNLAVAVTNSFDRHVNPLWDHGHIKFWSRKTLALLLTEAGFVDIVFHRVGRIPALAKSMIAVARKSR
jgi:2-polyprenyl-6-hydroxyphenyl methylase/3-demethylubiquinone-9 3-methyltransferase